MTLRLSTLAALVSSSLLAAACGGGRGGGGGTTPPAGGTISGTVVKGPVGGAGVMAFAIANGAMGAQVGSAAADSSGNFTVSIGNHSGPVMLMATGGTYTDEATGTAMPMLAGDMITCVIPSVASGEATTGVQMTPLTAMAQAMAAGMTGGMTPANMTTANAAVGDYFSVGDIVHTPPMNPMTAGSGAGATQAARNYGMTLAAVSEYARTIGMTTSSSGVVTAMMEDASDGVMNGMMGATSISMMGMGGMMGGGMMAPTAGTAGLATAMTAFVGSAMNASGVSMTDMQPLVDKLSASAGTLR